MKPNSSITCSDRPSGVEAAGHLDAAKLIQAALMAGAIGHLQNTQDTYVAFGQVTRAGGTGANSYPLSALNGSGSGKIIRLLGLHVFPIHTALVASAQLRFDVTRITAHSGGTAITPEALDSDNPALPAQVTVRADGTVTEGNRLFGFAANDGLQTEMNENAFIWNALRALNLAFESPRLQELTFREGEGVACKQISNSSTNSSTSWACIMAFSALAP